MTSLSPLADPNLPVEAFNLFRKWDTYCLALLILIGVWFSIDADLDYTVNLPVGDREFYINMALYPPTAFKEMPAIYAQRFLPSLLVWIGVKFFGLTFSQGFLLLSYSSFMLFLPLVYYLLRSCSVPLRISFGTSVFCGISFWPVTSSLVNFYQACDAMMYPIVVFMIILALRRKTWMLFFVSILAVLVRQQFFVLAILSFIHLYIETRDRFLLVYLSVIIVCIGMLIKFAGTDGAGGLAKHTIYRLFDLDVAVKGIIRTRLPIMLSPFLLLLICFFRKTCTYMKKYWWISLFAIITIIQPLFSFEFTGIFDAQRLIMMGVWPFFLLAGLLLRDLLKNRWTIWVYFALPLCYGTEHLNILEHAYPSMVGHRIMMNGIILALVLLDLFYNRQIDQRGSH